MLEMPGRYVFLELSIDTNRINARQQLPSMNQLEEWRKRGVISLEMSQVAFVEATAGHPGEREPKAKGYVRCILRESPRLALLRQQVVDALFPSGCRSPQDHRDVDIVLAAQRYGGYLVTDDGASNTQPAGILGRREQLARLGVNVMRDCEAVCLVRTKIEQRDDLARSIAKATGQQLPDWVGAD